MLEERPVAHAAIRAAIAAAFLGAIPACTPRASLSGQPPGAIPTTDAASALVNVVGDGGSESNAGREGASCSSDAECGNPFLVCAPDVNVCTVRYNLPCRIDSDCGPGGFSCNLVAAFRCPGEDAGSNCGACNGSGGSCSADADCPQGWSCYSPCPCPTRTDGAKGCYPPFGRFGCPVCIVAVVDAG